MSNRTFTVAAIDYADGGKLMKRVLKAIEFDLRNGETTALEEMLLSLPKETLRNYSADFEV